MRTQLSFALLVSLIAVSAFFSSQALGVTELSLADLQRRGTEALDANRYWLAEPLLKEAVSEAEKMGFNHPGLAKSLGELGRYYTIRGRFSVAEPILERELAARESMYERSGGQIIPSMGELIRFYLNYGTASKADPLTDDMLAFVDGKAREPRIQALTKVTRQEGAPLVGVLATAAPSEINPLIEWAITCDSVGNAYRARGKFDTAEKLYKTALDLKARVLGEGHLSLAGSYDCLGLLCMDKGEMKDAESYFRDALATTEKTLSPQESPEVYSRLDRLAKCLIKEKKYSEAAALYQRALSDFWTKGPSKAGEESRALYALGSLYVEQRNYSAASHYLRMALKKVEKFNGPCSIALVPYLDKYAYSLYYLGRRGECNNLRARAVFINGAPLHIAEKQVSQAVTLTKADGKNGSNGSARSKKRRYLAGGSRGRAHRFRRHR